MSNGIIEKINEKLPEDKYDHFVYSAAIKYDKGSVMTMFPIYLIASYLELSEQWKKDKPHSVLIAAVKLDDEVNVHVFQSLENEKYDKTTRIYPKINDIFPLEGYAFALKEYWPQHIAFDEHKKMKPIDNKISTGAEDIIFEYAISREIHLLGNNIDERPLISNDDGALLCFDKLEFGYQFTRIIPKTNERSLAEFASFLQK